MHISIHSRFLLPLLFLPFLLPFGIGAEGSVKETAALGLTAAVEPDEKVQHTEALSLEAAASYEEAVAAYETAMPMPLGAERTEMLNEGIRLVNDALEKDPANAEAMMLVSQLYGARGGKSYARQYAVRASELLKRKILNSGFEDRNAMLCYAILCYADGSADRRKTAEHQARYLLQSVEGKQAPETRRMEGLAHFLLGEQDVAQRLLEEAAPKLVDLLEDTVERDTWLWPVKPERIPAEFLLYALRHTPDC